MSNEWSGHYTTLTYVDPETNANKFYRIAIISNDVLGDHRVVYQWGRAGSTGQSSFKMYSTQVVAQNHANHRYNLKVRKGYADGGTWEALEPNMLRDMLGMGGVNTNTSVGPVVATEDGGVTFDEMGTLVGELLTAAVTKENDTVDVVVEAATMNAKFAQLREQFENIESEVEFVNTAVRSRL